MPAKEISGTELRKLISLVRPIVLFQIEYLEKGFSCQDSASAFAEVFIHEFRNALTDENAKKIKSGSIHQSDFSRREAAISYSLSLVGELSSAVVRYIERTRGKTSESS